MQVAESLSLKNLRQTPATNAASECSFRICDRRGVSAAGAAEQRENFTERLMQRQQSSKRQKQQKAKAAKGKSSKRPKAKHIGIYI